MRKYPQNLSDYLMQIVQVNGTYCWADLMSKEQRECCRLLLPTFDDADLLVDEIGVQKLISLHYLGIYSPEELGDELMERYEEACINPVDELMQELYQEVYGVDPYSQMRGDYAYDSVAKDQHQLGYQLKFATADNIPF